MSFRKVEYNLYIINTALSMVNLRKSTSKDDVLSTIQDDLGDILYSNRYNITCIIKILNINGLIK